MLGAMGGDMAFAAAILEAGETERAQRQADPRRGLRQMENDMEAQQTKADVQAKAIAQANKVVFDQIMQSVNQRPVQVVLDGRVIAESVNAVNNRDARRN
jgi:uncharacterized protein (DUF427 family)